MNTLQKLNNKQKQLVQYQNILAIINTNLFKFTKLTADGTMDLSDFSIKSEEQINLEWQQDKVFNEIIKITSVVRRFIRRYCNIDYRIDCTSTQIKFNNTAFMDK